MTTCGCSAAWQRPKPNGTCATCGGWLPGERPKPLPWIAPASSEPQQPGRDQRA